MQPFSPGAIFKDVLIINVNVQQFPKFIKHPYVYIPIYIFTYNVELIE